MSKKILIIGGGAAGYFLASNLPLSADYEVDIIEKSKSPLQKVKVSGGGRCNVTHAEFVPNELVKNYPRGQKELHSVFARFQPGDTFAWFGDRNLELKTEEDLRVFPVTDSSQSIIDILEEETRKNGVTTHFQEQLQQIEKTNDRYVVKTSQNIYEVDVLVVCTGSSKAVWEILERDLNHSIIPPVPSLFTFNCKAPIFEELEGTSFSNANLSIPSIQLAESGPLLVTHWGMSGPAVLKLSAFGARELAKLGYHFEVEVNFLNLSFAVVYDSLLQFKNENSKQQLVKYQPFIGLTKRFWNKVIWVNRLHQNFTWQELSKGDVSEIAKTLTAYTIQVQGKSTYKDEFVTAGGVDLKEVDMRTMQSKLHPNLFFAGEVLNIDGITGGFNFQACWSEAYIIADCLRANL